MTAIGQYHWWSEKAYAKRIDMSDRILPANPTGIRGRNPQILWYMLDTGLIEQSLLVTPTPYEHGTNWSDIRLSGRIVGELTCQPVPDKCLLAIGLDVWNKYQVGFTYDNLSSNANGIRFQSGFSLNLNGNQLSFRGIKADIADSESFSNLVDVIGLDAYIYKNSIAS